MLLHCKKILFLFSQIYYCDWWRELKSQKKILIRCPFFLIIRPILLVKTCLIFNISTMDEDFRHIRYSNITENKKNDLFESLKSCEQPVLQQCVQHVVCNLMLTSHCKIVHVRSDRTWSDKQWILQHRINHDTVHRSIPRLVNFILKGFLAYLPCTLTWSTDLTIFWLLDLRTFSDWLGKG